MIAFVILVFFACCSNKHDIPPVDYSESFIQTQMEWACYKQFSSFYDSSLGHNCMRVTDYGSRYPGVELVWTYGNWNEYDSIFFMVKTGEKNSTRFYFAVWDGFGELSFQNRFQHYFTAETEWKQIAVNISEMRSPNGRPLLKSKITWALLVPEQSTDSFEFSLSNLYFK